MTRNVLLVGASGPLGRAIGSELAALGHAVTGVSRSGGAGSRRVDVTDRLQTQKLLERERPFAVVYLARPELDDSLDVRATIASAVDALHDFATQCAAHGVNRLIFTSSAAVYGTDARTPRRESDAVAADSAYAELKLRSEEALDEVRESGALAVQALRIFNVYGSGFSNSLVNRLVVNDGPAPFIHNTEQFVRDYIHVSDVTRAIGVAVGLAQLNPTVLNLGSGIGTSNRSLLALCPEVEYSEHPRLEIASYSVADISLLRELWGFQPSVDLATAVRQPEKYFN